MSLISDYIGERLKAGEDVPVPTMRVAARLLRDHVLLNELMHSQHITPFYHWALRHATEVLIDPPTPQMVEARRLAELPFD